MSRYANSFAANSLALVAAIGLSNANASFDFPETKVRNDNFYKKTYQSRTNESFSPRIIWRDDASIPETNYTRMNKIAHSPIKKINRKPYSVYELDFNKMRSHIDIEE